MIFHEERIEIEKFLLWMSCISAFTFTTLPAHASQPKLFPKRIAVESGYKYGYVNAQGKVVIPIIYDAVHPAQFLSGKKVQKDGTWIFVNAQGKEEEAPTIQQLLERAFSVDK